MPFSLNRAINVEDFADPSVRSTIREVFAHEVALHPDFPSGREHRKHWEIAMAVLTLRETGVLRPDAEVLGIGAGNEATIFWLTNHVRRVWATDLYADPGVWEPNASPSMMTEPGRHWPGPWNPRRLVVQHVNALELPYDDESFDAIFSSGSIEHFGGLDQARQAMAEAYRVLKPGGVVSMSTEYLLDGDPLATAEQTIMFTSELIADVLIGDHDWAEVTPPDHNVSPATLGTEMPIEEMLAEYQRHIEEEDGNVHLHELEMGRYPHAVLRAGANVFTSVHLALRKHPAEAPSATAPEPPPVNVAIEPRPLTPVPPVIEAMGLPEAPLPVSGPLHAVADLAQHLHDPVVIVDAGCRWGFPEHWADLEPHVRMIGFDPDEAECRRLDERYRERGDATIVPIALGSAPERRRMRCFKFSGANSFHPHDEPGMSHMAVPRDGDVLEQLLEVEIDTLDRWCADHDVPRIDAMKLDVQGHELEILRGATDRLADVRAIEAEVCLNPITAGTPLFGEVDAFLRERGFYLWRLRDLQHYPIKEGEATASSIEIIEHLGYERARWAAPPGFVSWCNAHWVRSDAFDRDAQLPWEARLRDAVLMNALRFHDLTVFALRRALEASPPEAVAERVRSALNGATRDPTPAPAPIQASPESEPVAAPDPVPAPPAEASGLRRRLRKLAARPYWPVTWRLERNHMHAQWRADALGQQVAELQETVGRLETSIATLDERLVARPPASRVEDEIWRALGELRDTHRFTNDAVAEWTALIGHAVGGDGDDARANGDRG